MSCCDYQSSIPPHQGASSAPKPKIAVRHTLASEARSATDRFAKVSLSASSTAPTNTGIPQQQAMDAAIHDQPCTLSLCEIMLLRRPAELQSQLQVCFARSMSLLM
jgi:hypothetical protein